MGGIADYDGEAAPRADGLAAGSLDPCVHRFALSELDGLPATAAGEHAAIGFGAFPQIVEGSVVAGNYKEGSVMGGSFRHGSGTNDTDNGKSLLRFAGSVKPF